MRCILRRWERSSSDSAKPRRPVAIPRLRCAGTISRCQKPRAKDRLPQAPAYALRRRNCESFKARYQPAQLFRPHFSAAEQVEAFVGLDGGSTSTKAVLLSHERRGAGQGLSALRGQPDCGCHRGSWSSSPPGGSGSGASLKILGVGTTGYAKDILRQSALRRRGSGRNRGAHRIGVALC